MSRSSLSVFEKSNRASGASAPIPAAVVSGTTGSPAITTSGTSTIYSFTGDGSITFSGGGFAQIVVVGGGGGGGAWLGGGGGAGGMLEVAQAYFSTGTHTVTVGAGGVRGPDGSAGNNGIASKVGQFYAPGGGGGGFVKSNHTTGLNGGSGGGAGENRSDFGFGISGLGNNGGTGSAGIYGGGGGASAASTGGNGGAGRATTITGSSVTLAGGGGETVPVELVVVAPLQ